MSGPVQNESSGALPSLSGIMRKAPVKCLKAGAKIFQIVIKGSHKQ
jgi:hypothetical protein